MELKEIEVSKDFKNLIDFKIDYYKIIELKRKLNECEWKSLI